MFKKLVATIKTSKIDNLTTIIRGTSNFVICIACYLIESMGVAFRESYLGLSVEGKDYHLLQTSVFIVPTTIA